jgi:hypothetical protein
MMRSVLCSDEMLDLHGRELGYVKVAGGSAVTGDMMTTVEAFHTQAAITAMMRSAIYPNGKPDFAK